MAPAPAVPAVSAPGCADRAFCAGMRGGPHSRDRSKGGTDIRRVCVDESYAWRLQFPALEEVCYLNTASIGLMPLSAQFAAEEFGRRLALYGTTWFDESTEVGALDRARQAAAAMLNDSGTRAWASRAAAPCGSVSFQPPARRNTAATRIAAIQPAGE